MRSYRVLILIKKSADFVMRNAPIVDVLDKIREEIKKIPTAPFATAYTAKHKALELSTVIRREDRNDTENNLNYKYDSKPFY